MGSGTGVRRDPRDRARKNVGTQNGTGRVFAVCGYGEGAGLDGMMLGHSHGPSRFAAHMPQFCFPTAIR